MVTEYDKLLLKSLGFTLCCYAQLIGGKKMLQRRVSGLCLPPWGLEVSASGASCGPGSVASPRLHGHHKSPLTWPMTSSSHCPLPVSCSGQLPFELQPLADRWPKGERERENQRGRLCGQRSLKWCLGSNDHPCHRDPLDASHPKENQLVSLADLTSAQPAWTVWFLFSCMYVYTYSEFLLNYKALVVKGIKGGIQKWAEFLTSPTWTSCGLYRKKCF
jgi:hypothetical protein